MNLQTLKSVLRKIPGMSFLAYLRYFYFISPVTALKRKLKVNKYTKAPEFDEIKKLKNTKLGEACVIVGNGPSVKMSDLDLIQQSGIDSFGANRILDILDKTEWHPTYLSVMDPTFITNENIRTHTPEEYSKQIEESGVKFAFLIHLLKDVLVPSEKYIYTYVNFAKTYSLDLMSFSDDASVYVSDLGNVISYSIQIAYYLGYRKIYVYGIDGTYPKYLDIDGKFKVREISNAHVEGIRTNSYDTQKSVAAKSRYFAVKEGGYADSRKDNKGYNMCREFAEKNEMEIINLTHGGAIENFERQSFYDVLKK